MATGIYDKVAEIDDEVAKGLPAGIIPHWSTEQIRIARPIGMPSRKVRIVPRSSTAELLRAALGKPGKPVVSDAAPPDDPKIETSSFAAPFQTTKVTDFTKFPYSAVGKLLMFFPNAPPNPAFPGVDTRYMMGSAWVVGKSTIFTAGHCLYDTVEGGGAASMVTFVANYSGPGTGVQWQVVKKSVPTAWKLSSDQSGPGNDVRDFTADMGICILNSPVQTQLGKLGYQANQNPLSPGPYTELGYPGLAPFDGNSMWQCVGNFVDTPDAIAGGVGSIRAASNFTPGCSGGPWADANDQFRVLGLNSHQNLGDPNDMISPYFGDRFLELLNWMTENGGDS